MSLPEVLFAARHREVSENDKGPGIGGQAAGCLNNSRSIASTEVANKQQPESNNEKNIALSEATAVEVLKKKKRSSTSSERGYDALRASPLSPHRRNKEDITHLPRPRSAALWLGRAGVPTTSSAAAAIDTVTVSASHRPEPVHGAPRSLGDGERRPFFQYSSPFALPAAPSVVTDESSANAGSLQQLLLSPRSHPPTSASPFSAKPAPAQLPTTARVVSRGTAQPFFSLAPVIGGQPHLPSESSNGSKSSASPPDAATTVTRGASSAQAVVSTVTPPLSSTSPNSPTSAHRSVPRHIQQRLRPQSAVVLVPDFRSPSGGAASLASSYAGATSVQVIGGFTFVRSASVSMSPGAATAAPAAATAAATTLGVASPPAAHAPSYSAAVEGTSAAADSQHAHHSHATTLLPVTTPTCSASVDNFLGMSDASMYSGEGLTSAVTSASRHPVVLFNELYGSGTPQLQQQPAPPPPPPPPPEVTILVGEAAPPPTNCPDSDIECDPRASGRPSTALSPDDDGDARWAAAGSRSRSGRAANPAAAALAHVWIGTPNAVRERKRQARALRSRCAEDGGDGPDTGEDDDHDGFCIQACANATALTSIEV